MSEMGRQCKAVLCERAAQQLGYTQWELMIATESEEEIENKAPCDCTRKALGWIDNNQKQIDPLIEISRIRDKVNKANPWTALPLAEALSIIAGRFSPEDKRAHNAFSRFCRGLDSPDQEQKARFEGLSEFIENHLYDKFGLVGILPILECLEEPVRAPGRPSRGGRPSTGNREILALMKPLIANGEPVAVAARRYSKGDISKQNVLERAWRWKASRRTE